jgi:two-component system OmpR family response regulator
MPGKMGFMSLQPHILLVEDDREIRTLVARYLTSNDFRVSQAHDGREMDRILADAVIDLIVLDLMLPGENGLALCRRLRETSALPILILSAKGDEIDRIVGLEIGADDYLTKPFNPRELLARMKAVLRRTAETIGRVTGNGPQVFRFLGWQVDTLKGVVLNPAGAHVIVTGAELDLLRVFCERPRRVLTRDQLIELTRGGSSGSSGRSVDILVSRLRRKVAPDGTGNELIRTVRSGGYVFTADVTSDS